MSFATGFFNTATETLDRKQQYVRDHRAKTRDYLMTYGTQAVTGAKSKVSDYVTIGMQLEGMGLEKDDLNYLVETSGPDALTNLYDKVKDYTSDELSPATFRSMIKRTKDYSTTSTYEQTIAKAFGLYKENVTTDPAKNEGIAYYASMLFNPQAADNETYIGGYTESDIRRIQGTVAPGMSAPLAVDFSKLPKRHSTTALGVYSQKSFVRMLDTAQTALDKMMPTTATVLDAEERIKYNKLELAIAAKDYRSVLELVPETGAEILRMDKETGGGLRNNSFFTFEPGMQEFFVNTAARLSGDNSYLQGKWDGAKKLYPDLGPLNSLKTFTTEAEARAAGLRYFILGGAIRINAEIPARVVDGNQPSTGSVTDLSETPASDSSSAPVADLNNASEIKAQMLGIDVQSNKAGPNVDFKDNEEVNPVLVGWTNLSLGALNDFDKEYTEYRIGSVNRSKAQNKADYKAYNDDVDTMASLTDFLGMYLKADARDAPVEELQQMSDIMGKKLQAAPERVRLIVESLLDKLADGEYDSTPVDDSLVGQVTSGIKNISNLFGGTKFNAKADDDTASTLEVNDPEVNDPKDVLAITNLNEVDPTDNATQFNSFDDVKAQLKSGELKQGDVILYKPSPNANNKYYTVDQSGADFEGAQLTLADPIEEVNTVKKSR